MVCLLYDKLRSNAIENKISGSIEAKIRIEEIKDVVKYIEIRMNYGGISYVDVFADSWYGEPLRDFIKKCDESTGKRVENAIKPYVEYMEGFFDSSVYFMQTCKNSKCME